MMHSSRFRLVGMHTVTRPLVHSHSKWGRVGRAKGVRRAYR